MSVTQSPREKIRSTHAQGSVHRAAPVPAKGSETYPPFMNELEIAAMNVALGLYCAPVRALEWGSGSSTVYFPARLKSGSEWLSVEHNAVWAEKVRGFIAASETHGIEVIHVPCSGNWCDEDGDGSYDEFRAYINFPTTLGKKFKLILVDGRARADCLQTGWRLLDEAGLMILHDAQRTSYWREIPPDCHYLRMTNPQIDIEGPISVIFMSNSSVTINLLASVLKNQVPGYLLFEQDEASRVSAANSNSWKKLAALPEKCLYAGDLPDFIEYAGLTGLSLNVNDNRHILHDITHPFPIPDNSVDSFQAEDVLEHIPYNQLVPVLDEIFRVLKPNGFFRLSLPDYGCDILQERSVKDSSGKIIFDPGGGGTTENPGHAWFPRIDEVRNLVEKSAFARKGKIEYLHYYNMDGSSLVKPVDYSKGHVNRTPDFDERVKSPYRPMSMIIDLVKMATPAVEYPPNYASDLYEKLSTTLRNGEELVLKGELDAAETIFKNLLELDETLAAACNNLGVISHFRNERQGALEYFHSALRIVPGHRKAEENRRAVIRETEGIPPAKIGIDISATTNEVSSVDRHSCILLNTYYMAFLNDIYKRMPSLATASYQVQKDALQNECFGDSDFYSEGLKKAGWSAEDLIINCNQLQQTWTRENGFTGEGYQVALEQIRRTRPQVVYFQDLSIGTKEFIEAVRPYTDLIVGQIASPVPVEAYLSGFDIIFSSFPHFVERFRQAGITSYYQPLAFESRVLDKIGVQNRKYPATFVGGISAAHGKGVQLLERIAELATVEFWGYGAESLPQGSVIRERHHGEAWGTGMFSLLGQSRITINRHIDVAENNANNMRLFEATGCGALLITDYKDNLNDLFEIGKEIVVYRSGEECASLINYYLTHPAEAEEIAKAGQARTLRDHTYGQRMSQTAEILARHLRYRSEQNRFAPLDTAQISYGHTPISPTEITSAMTSAWQNDQIPNRQRALVQHELDSMYQGKRPLPFQVLADILRPFARPGLELLEIGCASGYYYEVLEYLLNTHLKYTGVDYSSPLVTMARDYYPHATFHVADGASLPFPDAGFNVVVSSCVILHVPDYPAHIAEAVRVAREMIVFHRTPVCRKRPTNYMKKFAYGVETVELIFNENELLFEFAARGLELIEKIEYHSNPDLDEYGITYLLSRNEVSGEQL